MRLFAVVLALLVIALSTAAPASAAPVVLTLGESLTAGVQPGPNGFRLTPGYTGLVVDVLRRGFPDLQHVNYGCPGATTSSFIRGGPCTVNTPPFGNRSQLASAELFLRLNRGKVKLVILGMGANDVAPCAKVPGLKKFRCLRSVLAKAMINMEVIVRRLRAAAGPGVRLVGLTYYNPFVALYLKGPKGQMEAAVSVEVIRSQMNLPLIRVFRGNGFLVADVATAFGTYRPFSEKVTVGNRKVPVAVAAICWLTWVCTPPSDIHANDFGYAIMARSVLMAA